MNIIPLRTRYSALLEPEKNDRQRKLCLLTVALASILAGVCLLFMGCTGPNQGPMTHAAFTAAVTLGEQIGLETHPEATPYVRAAVPVVCAVANGTNVTPAEIVKALEAANVTNVTAKLIINGGLAIFNVVVTGLGTNQTEIRAYGQDLCDGMRAGLPPESAMARKASLLPPHLR